MLDASFVFSLDDKDYKVHMLTGADAKNMITATSRMLIEDSKEHLAQKEEAAFMGSFKIK